MNARILALSIASSLVSIACGDTTTDEGTQIQTQTQVLDGWTLKFTPQTGPLTAGEERFMLELEDDVSVVTPSFLDVEAWMPMHGHGTMKPTETREVEMGVYETKITFNMPGLWEVKVDTDDRQFKFDLEVE